MAERIGKQTPVDADLRRDKKPRCRRCPVPLHGWSKRSGRGAKAIFPNVTVQRCIVHFIRSSIEYVPNKDYKLFTAHLKKVYGAASLKAAESRFESVLSRHGVNILEL